VVAVGDQGLECTCLLCTPEDVKWRFVQPPTMHTGTGKLGDYLPRAGVAARRYRARRDAVLARLQRGSPDRSVQRSSQVTAASASNASEVLGSEHPRPHALGAVSARPEHPAAICCSAAAGEVGPKLDPGLPAAMGWDAHAWHFGHGSSSKRQMLSLIT
jgi:hypothetical protein